MFHTLTVLRWDACNMFLGATAQICTERRVRCSFVRACFQHHMKRDVGDVWTKHHGKKQRKKTIEKTNGAKKEHILLLHYIIIIIIYIPKIKIGTLETCWDMLIDIYIYVCVITVCVCARVIALYRFIRTITVSSFYWSINSIAGTGTSGRRRHQVTEQWHLSLWPSTTGAPMERRFNTNKNLQFSCGSRMGPLGHFDPTWAPHIIIRITPGRP